MRTDREFEDLVRATLATHATAIGTAPAWSPPPTGGSHQRWWLPALAATVVVTVAAGVFLGVRLTGNDKPAHPTPKPTPTPVPTVCSATLPAAWNRTVRAADVQPSGSSLQPVAIAPNGTLLAAGGTNPDTERITAVIVAPDRTATAVKQLPAQFVLDARTPGATNDWAVFGARNVSWTNDVDLWVVDLKHGNAVHKILDLTRAVTGGGRTLQDWLLLGNDVYYTVSDTYPSAHYRLYRYSLTTGSRTQLASGARLTMHSVYGSLSYRAHPDQDTWGPQVVLVPGTIPRGTPVEVTNGETPVESDGTAVAWTETTTTIHRRPQQTAFWWSPGRATPRVVLQRPLVNGTVDPAFSITSVAGPFVIMHDYAVSPTLIADARTSAVAAWSAKSFGATWFAGPGGGGRLPVVHSSAKFGPNMMYVPEIGSLPPLHCR